MTSTSSPCASSSGTCWICLQDGDDDELQYPCKCPRAVHPQCMARWQLQMAGREEEKRCRFCDQGLPDWRPILTPDNLTPQVPLVSVHYKGACYRLRIKPGPEGLRSFRRELQRITGLTMLECMQITFQCKSPDAAAQELCFKGMSAFDAAMHCASVSAAERLNRPAATLSHRDAASRTAAVPSAVPAVPSVGPPASPPTPPPTSLPAARAPAPSAASSSPRPTSLPTCVPVQTSVASTSALASASDDLPMLAGANVTRDSVDSIDESSSSSESQLSSSSDSDGASSVGGEPGCIVVPSMQSGGGGTVGGTTLFDGGARVARSTSLSGKGGSLKPGHIASLWTTVRKWLA